MCILFLPFDRCYILHTTMLFTYYWHILLHLQAIKMICLKLFLICKLKDPNLAKKLTNLAENLLKNLTPRSSWSLFFPSLTEGPYALLQIEDQYVFLNRLCVARGCSTNHRSRGQKSLKLSNSMTWWDQNYFSKGAYFAMIFCLKKCVKFCDIHMTIICFTFSTIWLI